jgi:hypothetical protein
MSKEFKVKHGLITPSIGSTTEVVDIVGSGSVKIPSGTTLERPASPTPGMLRYNTTDGIFEGYNGVEWTIAGPEGEVGPAGPTGPTGPTGAASTVAGPTGPTGPQGNAGPSTAINATNDTTTTELYPVMVGAAGSNQTPKVSTSKIYFNAATGTIFATSKSFRIPHPLKKGYLTYGSLEGPENGVYVRGRTQSNVIELPDYWTALVDESTITVELTDIGKSQQLYVEEIKDNKVFIRNGNWIDKSIDCYFTVYGERKDIDKLQVEV